MASNDVTLKVGSVYYELDLDTKKFKQKAKGVKDEVKNVGSTFSGVGNAAKSLGLSLVAAFSVGSVIQGLRGAISAATELERSMLGLSQVARAFGIDAGSANKAAQDLARDGLMTVQESSEGLKNLLATGFSLPEAIQLMESFKDASAANRQGTLGFGEAIIGATQGIKNQNSVMVDNVGISKNLSVILREQGLSVDDLQNVTSDANVRQKLFNGLMQEASIFSGAAADSAETLGGSLAQLSTQANTLAAAVGTALGPGIQFAISQFTGFGDAANGINNNMLAIQNFVIKTVGAFIILGKTIWGVGRMMAAGMTMNFAEMEKAFSEMIGGIQQTAEATNQKVTDNTQKHQDKQNKIIEDSQEDKVDVVTEAERKIAKQLEDETYNFEKNMEKRKKSFAESLKDMIFSHLDKVDDLKKKISEETDDFNENMAERSKKFKQSMDDMIKDHEKKSMELRQQLAEEQADAKEAQDEMTQEANDRLAKEKREHDKKRIEIETQIDKEVAKGKNASQSRIRMLQADLLTETQAYEEKTTEINAKVDKELTKSKQSTAEKLADIQQKIIEEDASFAEQKTRAEQEEIAETERVKKEHAERVSDYNLSLAQEQEILNRHQGEVNAVKDQAREDDISRLIRQYNEENEEATKEHTRRMAEIKTRGDELGKTLGDGINGGLLSTTDDLKQQVKDVATDTGQTLDNTIRPSALEAGRNMISSLLQGIQEKIGGAREYISSQMSNLSEYAKSRIPGFAGGVTNFRGGLAVVGEQGPELVRLPKGSDVIPNDVAFGGTSSPAPLSKTGSSGGLNQDIKIYIDKVNNAADFDEFGREFGFRAALAPNMETQ